MQNAVLTNALEGEIEKRIFDFAYRIALDDAVRQSAYNGSGTGSKTRLRECEPARAAVKAYVDDVLSGKRPDFYETEQLVEDSFEKYNTENWHGTFTFGNAQKLINMTAKYMFMTVYGDEEKARLFDQCHCPMDTQTICKVAELVGMLVGTGELTHDDGEKMLGGFAAWRPRKEDWSIKDGFSWGKMTSSNKEPYERFQETVRFLAGNRFIINKLDVPKPLSSLEFDYFVWA